MLRVFALAFTFTGLFVLDAFAFAQVAPPQEQAIEMGEQQLTPPSGATDHNEPREHQKPDVSNKGAVRLLSTEDLTSGFINDRRINAVLHQRGIMLRDSESAVTADTLLEQLETVGTKLDFELPTVDPDPEVSKFDRSYQSTLIMANLYDCGRCDKAHVATAGAVVLSHDGLVLTNHHVVNSPNDMFNFFAMSSDGRVFPVVEVLATSKSADLAIVRIKADNLTPVTLATERPDPMDPLFVVSHPHDRYYSTSTGVVSRFSNQMVRGGKSQNWMEITAKFSQGSSGSGVFNDAGELIGLVSRKDTIFQKGKDGKSRDLNLTIFKCVPLTEIKKAVGLSD